jgi:CBS domain-containing protein
MRAVTPENPGRPLLDEVRRALAPHAPFDALEPAALDFLLPRLRLAYYPRGALLLAPESGPADRLFILKQGRVRGGADTLLEAGESFPVGALVGRRAAAHAYRAEGDAFCWELDAADFHALQERSARFRDWCADRLAVLLDRAQRARRAEAAAALSGEASLLAPLSSALAREAVWCRPETPLAQALATMRDERVGAMVVCGEDRIPAGILTTHDVLHRLAAGGRAPEGPIAGWMTPAPVALEEDAPLADAALAMAHGGFRHIVVTSGGRLRGVVSERDLFALQRASLARLAASLRAARSVPELAAAAAGVRQAGRRLLAQGVDAEHLTQMTSALNDGLVRRLAEISAGGRALPARWCWLALGSEGRVEQTFATDQDNALLFSGDAAARDALLGFADAMNRGLEACGFPLCPGDLMARNPRWCLALDEWRERFDGWMRNPLPEALLRSAIFFDLRPLAGEAALAGTLRAAVLAQARTSPGFLRAMAANALRVRPPLGLFGDLLPDDSKAFPGTIDLKGYGARPLTDAARVYALAHGLAPTGTAARLRAAAAAGVLPGDEAAAAVDAFHVIQGLRLRHQHLDGEPAPGAENRIDAARLNDVDRRVLKVAFRQAARLQDRLRADFAL